ncbi:hypothetical protein C8R46DRAFT_1109644 [Mycena filopes]|nr:hypothetical protein C8R46DRAFT_1109644 [Mycena filopes]
MRLGWSCATAVLVKGRAHGTFFTQMNNDFYRLLELPSSLDCCALGDPATRPVYPKCIRWPSLRQLGTFHGRRPCAACAEQMGDIPSNLKAEWIYESRVSWNWNVLVVAVALVCTELSLTRQTEI